MTKKGLCDTAKRLMKEFSDDLHVGETFSVDNVVQYVNDRHSQIRMTTHIVGKWCSQQNNLQNLSPGIWIKTKPRNVCRRCGESSSVFWHPFSFGGEPPRDVLCDKCLISFYNWLEGKE